MPTKIEPGILVAHKTQPSVPWVVLCFDESINQTTVAYVNSSGVCNHNKFYGFELVSYADGTLNAIDAVIAAIREDDKLDSDAMNSLLSRAEELHDDYMEWIGEPI